MILTPSTAALHLDADLRCGILTKEGVGISNSWLAQGGIAAAVAKEDNPRFHFEDTLAAGAGLCDPEAVAVLVDEGPQDIATLVSDALPLGSAPAGRIAFKVRRPDRPDDPIVDAKPDE